MSAERLGSSDAIVTGVRATISDHSTGATKAVDANSIVQNRAGPQPSRCECLCPVNNGSNDSMAIPKYLTGSLETTQLTDLR